MPHLISPSLLSADFTNLKEDIKMLNRSKADWFHLDVMDGVFVPNISFGFPIIKQIKQKAKKPLDVHLMIIKPDTHFEECKKSGVDILTFHIETSNHVHKSINTIKELDMKAGITLNPHTSINTLENIINDVDIVLLMSVNPGFGGQKFIENTYNKITELKELIIRKNSKALIEIDGGVNIDNASKLVNVGADVLVAGSAVFKAPNPEQMISDLKNLR